MLNLTVMHRFRNYWTRPAAAVVLAIAGSLCISSLANAESATSISKDGITWTFTQSHPVGQFANGEWWVVGPVTLDAITPAWDGVRHGTVLNPMASDTDQGFDTRIDNTTFRAALNIADDLPVAVPNHTSVVSVKSFQEEDTEDPPILESIAILTVLSSAPPAGSFRPPYAGHDKTILGKVEDLDYTFLKTFAPVPSTPSKTSIDDEPLRFPILDLLKNWQNSGMKVQAAGVDHNYGRQIAYKAADVALWLNLNYPVQEKESVMIKAVQRGIDVYGLARHGDMEWQRNGGHNLGRKMYLVLAAKALNHEGMLEWCDGTRGIFQEDTQHFYVTQSDIDTPRATPDLAPFTQVMLGMPEWSSNPVSPEERLLMGSEWDKAYRVQNGAPNTGIALAANLMGLRDLWNREPFFEYIEDRFWPEENQKRAKALNKIYPFHAEMWDAYHISE
ncbi:MAG: hypothetical protein ACRCXD_03105 [Luteolibacter sp.]